MELLAQASEHPPAATPVADGVTRSLDPRVVQLDRIAGVIFTAFISGALLIGAMIAWLAAGMPVIILLAWPVITGLLLWLSYAWPPVDFRQRSYRVDARGIEIRHGVFWR